MSKIKRSLPEDIDITDPRDSGVYDHPDTHVNPERDVTNALWEMTKGVEVLKTHAQYVRENDKQEVLKIASKLTDIAENQ